MKPRRLSRAEVRSFLVDHLGLARPRPERGARGVRELLRSLRCIQLDPLDPIGTNADLVALARVDGIARNDVYDHLLPGFAFEHFAKERCLLPAEAFPYYRDRLVETPWWRLHERAARVPEVILERVLDEVRRRGPITARELEDHGRVDPIDWSGWQGTKRTTSMALEILWTRCALVVAGRNGKQKRYDVPERALPKVAAVAATDFTRWAVVERAHAAGLLTTCAGPHWSMLSEARSGEVPRQLVREGVLELVEVEGSPRTYLMPAAAIEKKRRKPDTRMRILGPLDPLLWDRKLVSHVFDFDYVWEVYKPAEARRFGWYVCPLLHEGKLVGRIQAQAKGGVLAVERVWSERGITLDRRALDEALARHAEALGARRVAFPQRALRGASR